MALRLLEHAPLNMTLKTILNMALKMATLKRVQRWMCVLACSSLLAACAVSNPPVIDKSPGRLIPPEYIVKQNDSLYSIAWAFGLDFQQLAHWNRIAKPYVIRPGQRLRLRPAPAVRAVATQPGPATGNTAAATAAPPKAQPKGPPAPATGGDSAAISWIWPAEGKLVGTYSAPKNVHGIQIAGRSGTAINATGAGEVVYVGEALLGYGKLIIVRHNPIFLSAYAHNQSILVAEGEHVRAGQQIATMGSSGANRTMLHFEIRKHGKPVDPLTYLVRQ